MVESLQVMSAFHARSAWKFIELVPLFRLPLVRSFEMCYEWLGIIRERHWLASNPKLVQIEKLEGRCVTADPSARTVRRLRSYPELVEIETFEGRCATAGPSARTVRRLRSYPKLVRMKLLDGHWEPGFQISTG